MKLRILAFLLLLLTLFSPAAYSGSGSVSGGGGGIDQSNVNITGGSIAGLSPPLPIASGGTNASSTANARTSLGVAIGSNVQAWDANLDQLAGLAPTLDNFIVGNGSAWILATASAVRTALGLVIGTNVQAWDVNLDQIAALTPSNNNILVGNGSAWTLQAPTTAFQAPGINASGSLVYQNPFLLNSMQWGYATASNSASAVNKVGILSGIVENDSTSARGADGTGMFFDGTTAATIGAAANADISLAAPRLFRVDSKPYLIWKFAIPTLTSIRFYAGVCDANAIAPTCINVDGPTVDHIGLQFSTVRPDTNFQITRGSGGAQTLIDTGVAATSNVLYFVIDIASTASYNVYLLDSTGATLYSGNITTNLMSSTTGLSWGIGVQTQANATRSYRFYNTSATLRP